VLEHNPELDTLFEEVNTYLEYVKEHLEGCTVCTKDNINIMHETAMISKTRWAMLTREDKVK